MAYPTEPTETIVTIATDANYSEPGKAWDGQPTKVSPSVGLQATGYMPEDPRPADYDNYLFNMLAKWATYFKEGFADLQTRISSDEWVYPTGKSRTVNVPLFSAFATATFPISAGTLPIAVASSTGGSASVEVPIGRFVPAGATITKIRALVNPATSEATAGDRMSLELLKSTISGTTLSKASQGVYYCATSSTGLQWIDSGTISKATASGEVWTAKVAAGLGTGTGDIFQILEVTFTDPGPRNF